MNASLLAVGPKIEAQVASEDDELLPRHFGRYMLRVEDTIFTFMRYLSDEYEPVCWELYELSNGGFYMAPRGERLRVRVNDNGFDAQMTVDAAGITACLLALRQLAQETRDKDIRRHFFQLTEFALQHAEASAIAAATA